MRLRSVSIAFLFGLGFALLSGCGRSVPPLSANSAGQEAARNSLLPATVLTQKSSRHYQAVQLPPRFVPYAIMSDGEIPGASGDRAAVYKDGALTLLPKSSECSAPTNTNKFITATSANSNGEIVGFCSGQRNAADFGHALYFNHGTVKVLPLPNPTYNNWLQTLSINDRGEILGSVNSTINTDTAASLVRFHREGTVATVLTGNSYESANGQVVVLNDRGHFAYTNADEIDDLYWATIGNRRDVVTRILPNLNRSFTAWMNERDAVVGYVGPYGAGSQAFIDTAAGPALIPLPTGITFAMATGINDRNDVVGEAGDAQGGEIFSYSGGTFVDLSPLIYPKQQYTALTNAAGAGGILPGLSAKGAFLAAVSNGANGWEFFVISPAERRN